MSSRLHQKTGITSYHRLLKEKKASYIFFSKVTGMNERICTSFKFGRSLHSRSSQDTIPRFSQQEKGEFYWLGGSQYSLQHYASSKQEDSESHNVD
jgi:hypothetical protein